MNKVFSIICTYNGREWIERCIDSLKDSYLIIVVDNGSTDGTVEFIERQYPNINLIKSQQNLGFGAANNIGMKYALDNGADYVFLLNQDAWTINDSLKMLVKILDKNKEYGVLSPIHLNGSGEMLDRKFGNYLYKNGGRKFITDKITGKDTKDIVNISFVNAAAWLLSRKCIEEVGYFDSLFIHYGEDTNYLQRVRFHGFKIGVLGSTFIHHDREGNDDNKKTNDNHVRTKYRILKTRWADVNSVDSVIRKDIESVIHSSKKSKIKSLIQFKIGSYKKFSDEINELNDLEKECSKSRDLNRKIKVFQKT